MQITWKGYRESEDKRRRLRVNIGGVCVRGYMLA